MLWLGALRNIIYIPGNVQADVAAKEAVTNNVISKINLSQFNDTVQIALEQDKKAHQNLWDGETNNKLYQIKPSQSPNLIPLDWPRNEQTVWSRVRIGHTSTPANYYENLRLVYFYGNRSTNQ